MSEDHPKYGTEELRAMIRETGLRCTSSRMIVLEKLVAAPAPISHAELADQLVPQGFDQATVYRNLTDLTEAGLLTRHDLGDHVWRFEFKSDDDAHDGEHPHFFCTDCGTVSCLTDVAIKVTSSSTSPPSFGEISEIFLKGRCELCR
ncbi:MAG: Fur family transcriptional regulator [Bradymonadaceae bacterium]